MSLFKQFTHVSVTVTDVAKAREFYSDTLGFREIARPAFEVRHGYIAVPERPGLGLELDEDALRRFPARQFPPRGLSTPASEGP